MLNIRIADGSEELELHGSSWDIYWETIQAVLLISRQIEAETPGQAARFLRAVSMVLRLEGEEAANG